MNSRRIVFVVDKPVYFRHVRPVVTLLDQQGHDVRIGFLQAAVASERGLIDEYHASSGKPQLELPSIAISKVARLARQLIDASIYSRSGHPSPDLYRRALPSGLACAGPIVRCLLRSKVLLNSLYILGQIEPKNSKLRNLIDSIDADAIVFCPYIFQHLGQYEFVTQASKAGTATLAQIASWDNLTTKRTFHALPDRILVWNEKLKREAIEIHGVPSERLHKVGAPVFDFWFEPDPSESKAQWNQRIGLPENSSYVLYLCSSKNICKDESTVINALIQACRSIDSNTFFLVRPHPTTEGIELSTNKNVVIYPPKGNNQSFDSSMHDFRQSIRFAGTVAGINTSAIIEAAILKKPCILLQGEIAGEIANQFGHVLHLKSLGSISVAENFVAAAQAIHFALKNENLNGGNVFANVVDFVRPQGLETSAAQLVVDSIIEAIAEKP